MRGRRSAVRGGAFCVNRQQHHVCRRRRFGARLLEVLSGGRSVGPRAGVGIWPRVDVETSLVHRWRALLRLLSDGHASRRRTAARQRLGIRGRRRASRRTAAGLQPLSTRRRRSSRGDRADVVASAVRHVVPARRFPERQRLLRREAGDSLECIEQDVGWARIRARAEAERQRHGNGTHRAHECGVREAPGLLRSRS